MAINLDAEIVRPMPPVTPSADRVENVREISQLGEKVRQKITERLPRLRQAVEERRAQAPDDYWDGVYFRKPTRVVETPEGGQQYLLPTIEKYFIEP